MTNLAALPYSACLQLTGPDTIQLLERLVTCRVDTMSLSEQVPGALLTPQGKVIADFLLTRTDEGCDLLTSAQAVADLEKRLKMFRLRADVQIAHIDLPDVLFDHAARIEAGQPAFGHDFTASDVFPTDINLDVLGGIDYKKGCFVGQEVVSRMKRRGKIRKRTVRLSGQSLAAGQDVRAGEILLGQITSAADDNALAIVRIDQLNKALKAGTPIEADRKPVKPALPDWLTDEMEALAHDKA